MCGVEEVGEQETDEGEGHADHGIPYKAEEGANRKAVDVHFVTRCKMTRSQNRSFPIRGCGIRSGGFVRLEHCQHKTCNNTGRLQGAVWVLTGGCSSIFSPRSGFALKFANTPSLEWEKAEKGAAPVEGLAGTLDETGGTTTGILVTAPGKFGPSPLFTARCSESDRWVLARMRRWRSSPTSFPSSSESEPSSKVSASVLSASVVIGSSDSRCLDDGDDARERNEGGGEDGMVSISEAL